jgi:hypothetical protein
MSQFRPPTKEELEQLNAANFRAPTAAEEAARNYETVGGIPVDVSPVPLPPDTYTTFGADFTAPGVLTGMPASMGQTIPRTEIPSKQATLLERAAAYTGVDIRNELREMDLRRAIGYSPNKAFTADFLKRSLSERYGLPEDEVVRWGPVTGAIEFFNPQTGRFTPVDSTTFTKGDLEEMYGPGGTIAFATGGALFGALGSPLASIPVGAGAAWYGETLRLLKGRDLGVHDLTDDQIISAANRVAKWDLAAGTGGEAFMYLRRILKSLVSPTGISAEGASEMLTHIRSHEDVIAEVNAILSKSGSDKTYVLPATQEVKGATVGGIDEIYLAEVKAADEALDAASRGLLNVSEGVPVRQAQITTPAQQALRSERDRVVGIAEDNLLRAEQRSRSLLAQYGSVNTATEGKRLVNLINVHSGVLRNHQKSAWRLYEDAIGMPRRGTPAFAPATEFTSNIQVPTTQHLVDTYTSTVKVLKDSALDLKSLSTKSLKKPKLGGTIDLAVLDRDIKLLREVMRSKNPTFSFTALQRDHDALVKLRNEYLLNNHPATLRLLEEAEHATTVYKDFIGESTFARIFKADNYGRFTIDDPSALRKVWNDKSGQTMRELVEISNQYFGGKAALQNSALRIYKANATPKGSNVQSLKLHNKFVEDNKDILDALFADPKLYQFGRFARSVERTTNRVKSAINALNRSGLGRIARGNKEKMAELVFSESMSEQGVRTAMNALRRLGPEAEASFRDAVGRHLYAKIAPDGVLSTKAMFDIMTKHGTRLQHIYGSQFLRRFNLLRKGLKAQTKSRVVGGPEKTTMFGYLARFLFNPPLTARGRGQTLAEALRYRAANRALHAALRDPKNLELIVAAGNREMTKRRAVAILSQLGAVGMLTAEDLTPDYSPANIPITGQ